MTLHAPAPAPVHAGDPPVLNTQGWDAVCAMNAEQVSALFRLQYLTDGPTSPVRPVRVAFTDNTDFVLVDTVLGPPEFSFSGDNGEAQCQLSMFLVSGSLLRVDPINSVVRSVLPVEPRSSWLNGPVRLSSVQGSDSEIGSVTLNLADAAYQPTVSGIEPGSTVLTEMGTALQTYFATQQTSYPLGTVQQSGVPACLQPTGFDIAVQQNPGSADDGAVLLLIKTNGSGSTTVGPLPVYPIPDGDTAALLVSGEVLFSSLIAPTLTQEFSAIGTTFSAQQSNGAYQVDGSGGQLDLGCFPPTQPTDGNDPWTSDDHGYFQKVVLVPGSFTVAPNSDSLVSTWTCSFEQYFSETQSTPYGPLQPIVSCTLDANVTTTFAATADPLTDIVSFSGTAAATLTPDNPGSWWDHWWTNTVADLPSDMKTALQQNLQAVFGAVQLPDVDTFALQNLLFPSAQVLRLATAGVPGDLQLTGRIESTLTVSPPTATLAPTGRQQFTAANAGSPAQVAWEIQPPLGTIDSGGLYQAPDAVEQPTVIIVTAIDQADASLVGKAMAVLAPAAPTSGDTVTPTALTLTAGQSYPVLVVDSDGRPADATCTLSPPGTGTLTQGYSTGSWIYTAPTAVTQPESVTISPGTSGNPATVQLAPTTTVTITASATTLNPGDTVTLTADADDLDQVSWLVFPTGLGTLSTTDGSASATFTAPASVQTEQSVAVMAWGQDPDIGIGIGLGRLTVLAG
ncbi:hypothetical protein [Streptomyces sp. NPDC048603]|uniref:hypothetical protein n=1 Tax=Streptomyces sp. NPDC048603 TaxID=3365577 RepID=UPI0037180F98